MTHNDNRFILRELKANISWMTLKFTVEHIERWCTSNIGECDHLKENKMRWHEIFKIMKKRQKTMPRNDTEY